MLAQVVLQESAIVLADILWQITEEHKLWSRCRGETPPLQLNVIQLCGGRIISSPTIFPFDSCRLTILTLHSAFCILWREDNTALAKSVQLLSNTNQHSRSEYFIFAKQIFHREAISPDEIGFHRGQRPPCSALFPYSAAIFYLLFILQLCVYIKYKK